MTFQPLLQKLNVSNAYYSDTICFNQYLKDNGIAQSQKTAQLLSVDEESRLAPELRKAGFMVLRLGYHATGPGTSFALVRAVNGWGDYFFDDKKEFDGTNQELFVPSVPASTLYPFRLLPKFTETSLVNLALASGLLGYALGIEGTLPSCPATGQGTYTFDFRPHSAIDVCYSHLNGQVEIDAVFTARRAGVETLFVVEAKASNELRQIAKHKLLYPVLSLKDRVPVNMTICPVYLRAVRRPGGLHFYIAEIEHEDGMHLNELNVRRRRHLVLEGMID